jgi:hypothetical protein
MILLGPAAFAAEARAALAACDRAGVETPEVYCVLSRANVAYDRLFETFGPWGRGPSLGRTGLGMRRRGWIDLAFDAPDMAAWCAGMGVALGPVPQSACHWSFYTRPGALALHRAILLRAEGTGAEEMRASGAPVFAAERGRRGAAPADAAVEAMSATPA